MSAVNEYLGAHLDRRLRALGLRQEERALVLGDVGIRLVSVLGRWRDQEARRTVLLPGREESSFYEPASADPDIRALVVVAVRNSLLEDFAADAGRAAVPFIGDQDIPDITKDAIRFFATVDLDAPVQAYEGEGESDLFAEIGREFPAAWTALSRLALPDAHEVIYAPTRSAPPGLGVEVGAEPDIPIDGERLAAPVLSGMAAEIDAQLVQMLALVRDGLPFAVFGSFKHCTRNPMKLCRVLEFILGHGGAFVTPNYFISDGYVSRRRALLRPAHFAQDVLGQLRSLSGISRRHKEALRLATSSLEA
jgi:hypothetical protein